MFVFGICKFILTIYRFIYLLYVYALIIRILPSKEPIAYCTTTENEFKTISTTLYAGNRTRSHPMSIDIDWVAIALLEKSFLRFRRILEHCLKHDDI